MDYPSPSRQPFPTTFRPKLWVPASSRSRSNPSRMTSAWPPTAPAATATGWTACAPRSATRSSRCASDTSKPTSPQRPVHDAPSPTWPPLSWVTTPWTLPRSPSCPCPPPGRTPCSFLSKASRGWWVVFLNPYYYHHVSDHLSHSKSRSHELDKWPHIDASESVRHHQCTLVSSLRVQSANHVKSRQIHVIGATTCAISARFLDWLGLNTLLVREPIASVIDFFPPSPPVCYLAVSIIKLKNFWIFMT